MTTGEPAPAGLALASYQRPVDVNPRLSYPPYRSTAPLTPSQTAGPYLAIGFGRCLTGPGGSYRVVTPKPGPLPGPDGGTEAPHIDVSVFARGLPGRLVTRIYSPGEPAANRADPVLLAVADPGRRATLTAAAQPGAPGGPGGFRFDIHLQGDQETVFFDV
jgi:protocatechuate 3,4-dioxygenase beta subunit